MKLGKKARRDDPRTLRLATYLTSDLPAVPDTVDYSTVVSQWGDMGNLDHGDCTCATGGHQVELWSVIEKNPVVVTTDEVLTLYGKVNGGIDEGAVLLDVLKTWRSDGLHGEHPRAFCEVDAKNLEHIHQSIALFAGCSVGLSLPRTAQLQAVNHEPWVPDPSSQLPSDPGSWGGHAVPIVGYKPGWLLCISWGMVIPMSEEFWMTYGDEAYAVLPGEWSDVIKPTGVDIEHLDADLAQLGD